MSADNTITKEEISNALALAAAVGEVIQTIGTIPSGHLYAMVQSKMSLQTYESLINMLVKAKLVRRGPSHLLIWIGDDNGSTQR